MARAKANEALRSKTKPNVVDELTRGIATLRELSIQIDDLSRDGFPYREAVRARTELSFRETIRRLFGEKSPEYQTHKHHKLKVGSRAESVQSTALLKEFIAALEIQKAELLGLTPDEVIAVVTAEPDRPSLPVAPPVPPPDSLAARSPVSPAPLTAVSISSSPAPAIIATATISPLPSSPSPPPTSAPVAIPSVPMPATDTMPLLPRETPAPRPIQSPPSDCSGPAEATVAPQVSITPPPVTPAPMTASAVTTTSLPVSSFTPRLAADLPIPATTISPIAPTMSAIPQGTIPPVPHTTLRPRPAPPVTIESPAQATANVTTPPDPASIIAPQPPQPSVLSLAAPTADSAPVSASEIRTVPPIVQTMPPTPASAMPQLQQEPPAHPIVAQATAPLRSSTPASTQSPIPEETPEAKVPSEQGTLDILRRVCARFHLVARQLRLRKEYRPTIEINDEYDLQDLFYALLRLQFDEVGTEEWTPAYTNGARRTGYLLDWEKTVVVVKQTRSGLTTKDLAEQIAADTAHYSARPNGAALVCFVYDPDGRVGNPRGLEADLSSAGGTYSIEVIVAPK
ncbi:MAG: hypothetical protein GDA65_17115 [Nitrospira sp. CR1.1]|nr:hypothetical protein [Nitrospira sp. CR1.1]